MHVVETVDHRLKGSFIPHGRYRGCLMHGTWLPAASCVVDRVPPEYFDLSSEMVKNVAVVVTFTNSLQLIIKNLEFSRQCII